MKEEAVVDPEEIDEVGVDYTEFWAHFDRKEKQEEVDKVDKLEI